MKTIKIVTLLFLAVIGLAGCVVVPAGPPRAYIEPAPPVVVVPARPYYHYHGGYWGHRYWR